MSMAVISVLGAGFCWLKPSVVFCARLMKSVLVAWCCPKPCCEGESGMWFLMLLRTNLSSSLDELQRRGIGW